MGTDNEWIFLFDELVNPLVIVDVVIVDAVGFSEPMQISFSFLNDAVFQRDNLLKYSGSLLVDEV